MNYYVLTGTGREYFETLDDAKTFAKYVKGVVKGSETDDIIADYYNTEERGGEMKGLIYRVVLKVGYNTAFFDFADNKAACEFAGTAMIHSVANEDTHKATYIAVEIINPEEEEEE